MTGQQARSAPLLPPGSWSMLPKHVRDCGALRRLRGGAMNVYAALVLVADWGQGGRACRTTTELCADTGLSVRSVRYALRALEAAGVVEMIERGVGAGRAAVYRIVTQKAANGCPFPQPEKRQNGDTKSGNPATEKGQSDDKKAASDCPPIRRQKEEQQQKAAAVVLALERAGVAEPTRSRLVASIPGLSAGIVQTMAAQVKRADSPAAVLVRRLEAEGPELVRQEQARAAAERQRRTGAAEAEQDLERERAESLGVIDSLSAGELDRIKAAVLDDPKNRAHRDRWRKADPRKNRLLAVEIRKRLAS